MPRRRYSRKRRFPYRRKRRRLGRPVRYRALTRRYVPSGMPGQRVAKLRWCRLLNFASSAGAMNTSIHLNCMGAYQPYSGSTNQPQGWDTWTSMYNHYTVLGSKATLTYSASAGTTTGTVAHIGCFITDDTSIPYTNGYEIIGAKRGVFTQITAGDVRIKTLRIPFSTKKQFNVRDMKDNLDRLGASVGANPSETCWFNMWIQAMDGGTFTANITCVVDYIVLFSEPAEMPTSVI